jgi:hypothetical protein
MATQAGALGEVNDFPGGTMAIAKIELPPRSDFGQKIVPMAEAAH